MELIIIRHGQSYVNLGNWDTLESMDTSLTELGHQQAKALGDWLKSQNAKADALYVSTMKRTRETADYVAEALNIEPIYDDRLREIGNAHHDGSPVAEPDLPRAFLQSKDTSQFTPVVTDVDNAESWMHFRIRLGKFFDDMLKNHLNQTVYVVAHGGVMSAMVDNLFNTGPYRTCDIHTDNTAWMHVKYKASPYSDWIIIGHNRIDHLIRADLV